ncbi:toll/interleukin-1 receptor domain-containing protein [Nannocystis pusilla]|uniref:toll/interleukin-1 receptor domain-containing protein n=1 Tax=Nannocystis pusilla TaxID=889268 RepID=UPI003BF1C910
MATIWLTYAHADNKDKDVDFIAQQLDAAGVKVHLDRWVIGAGRRLWEQIEAGIKASDAWMIYATQISVGSEPCKEELAYALDKALGTRGTSYPVIALFPGSVDTSILQSALKTRLCISTTDDDWKERIASAAEGRPPQIARAELQPLVIKVHRFPGADYSFVVEVRPRAGVWSPLLVAMPPGELVWREEWMLVLGGKDAPDPHAGSMLVDHRQGVQEGWAYSQVGGQQVTPSYSAYVLCKRLPSKLLFGSGNGSQYVAENLDGSPIRVTVLRP